MKSRQQIIGHLDADCFYVSAERVRFACLKGIPVGVLGNQGACVIAKSYEMKACGVKTGQPIWEAVRLAPQGVFIKRDFHWYEVISRQMLEIVQANSETVEYYSIDEFFFDAKHLALALGGTIHEAALKLQLLIQEEVGVPVSIGISRSRTLAKLASDEGKPFGCYVLLSENEIREFIEKVDIREVTGIGNRSALKLAKNGIKTCGDFCRANHQMINRLLTKKGEALWWELQGEAVTPIVTGRPMHKAVARGGSIGESTDDPERLNAWLVRNVERLIEALVWHRYVCHHLSLSVEYKEGRRLSKGSSLPEATNSSDLLIPLAKFLFEHCWLPQLTVSHIHVIAEQLNYVGQHQRSLFVAPPTPIDSLKQLVNDQLGRFKLRSGETLPLTEIYDDDAHNYDICDIYGKSCF